MVRVNVEVEERIRDAWKKHAHTRDKYANMSHFVRTAVTNQIKYDREYGSPFADAVDSSSGGDDFEDALDDFREDMNDTIASLQNDLRQVQIQIEGTENEAYLNGLMADFHDLLPRTSESEIRSGDVFGTEVQELVERARQQRIVEADSRDQEEMDARKALQKLTADVPNIKSVRIDDERHYFEEV